MLNLNLQTYLLFFGVEVIVLCGIALHRNQQISQRIFESLPVVQRVEEFDDKGLDLDTVQVGKLLTDEACKVLTHEIAVALHSVRRTLVCVQLHLRVYYRAVSVNSR